VLRQTPEPYGSYKRDGAILSTNSHSSICPLFSDWFVDFFLNLQLVRSHPTHNNSNCYKTSFPNMKQEWDLNPAQTIRIVVKCLRHAIEWGKRYDFQTGGRWNLWIDGRIDNSQFLIRENSRSFITDGTGVRASTSLSGELISIFSTWLQIVEVGSILVFITYLILVALRLSNSPEFFRSHSPLPSCVPVEWVPKGYLNRQILCNNKYKVKQSYKNAKKLSPGVVNS